MSLCIFTAKPLPPSGANMTRAEGNRRAAFRKEPTHPTASDSLEIATMASANSVKQLKIKTGSVVRCGHPPTRDCAATARISLELCSALASLAERFLFSRRSLCKDLKASAQEIASQEARIESIKTDPEKDEFDVRKQNEVLKEYTDGVLYEVEKLTKAYEVLKELLVRAPNVAGSVAAATRCRLSLRSAPQMMGCERAACAPMPKCIPVCVCVCEIVTHVCISHPAPFVCVIAERILACDAPGRRWRGRTRRSCSTRTRPPRPRRHLRRQRRSCWKRASMRISCEAVRLARALVRDPGV